MFSAIHTEFQMLQKFQFMQLQKQLSGENVNLNILNKHKSQPELGLEEGNSFPIDTVLFQGRLKFDFVSCWITRPLSSSYDFLIHWG